MKPGSLCLSLFLLALPLQKQESKREFLVFWGSPRGQMVSWIRWHECLHFDAGLAPAFFDRLFRWCGRKKNHIFLSHQDPAHNRSLRWMLRNLDACISRPGESPGKASADCPLHPLVKIWAPDHLIPGRRVLSKAEREDQKSHVYFLEKPGLLLPGDSPPVQEKQWLPWAKELRPRMVTIGHSRRRSVPSAKVLNSLPDLRWAVSHVLTKVPATPLKTFLSAKMKAPSRPWTRSIRAEKAPFPIIDTFDWGTLILEL